MERDELEIRDILEQLDRLYESGDKEGVCKLVEELSPDSIAELLDILDDPSECQWILECMDDAIAAETLMLLYPELRIAIVERLSDEKLARYIAELPSDDAAELLREVDEKRWENILKLLPQELAEQLVELISHPGETAGAIMAHEVESLPGNYTVAQAIADLVRFGDDIEEIFQIFIVDDDGKLLGFVPIQRLLIAAPGQKLAEIAQPVDVVVPVDADREYVVDLFRRKDIVSAPVVDSEGKLLGRITIDDVLDVADEESSKDIYKLVGIEVEEGGEIHDIRKRMPWLLVAFVGELVSGFVLKSFSSTIVHFVLLTSFIPLIMALGGNVGMQSAAVMIRKIALSRWGTDIHSKTVLREIFAGFALGVITGGLLFLLGWFWGDLKVGFVAAVAIIIAMTISATVGSTLPVIFNKLGTDPAFATGPFITTFNDVIGLTIYMVVASVLLNML